ncbi:ATP-binding cassette domain-containing protein [Pseudarthrobacter sp. J1738]|uniref:ATP-binding cassette domain-containing protein n=1 Tax=Pseudarthrobacter sp. J1738 TaxID=3420446 RepID=UPI003D26D952
MMFRPAPLRAAAALAAVFIAARVIYRVLFNGAGLGAGLGTPVLLDLPALRLPPPYAHVIFLGPVTAPGLWQAVLSALPIALMILAFGVLNSVVDISRGFVRLARGGPLQGVARMLVVAWAALPALASAVASVRLAFRLRGERFGPRAMVPILERTLEHASRVAAALELRGFGARFSGQNTYDGVGPVRLRNAEFRIGSASIAVADFAPSRGTVTVITGPTGSGKSTILRGISGLLSHVDGGSLSGEVLIAGKDRAATPPRETAGSVGVVLQNPRAAFATSKVRDEIALALELQGVPAAAAKERVLEVACHVGVTQFLDRDVSTLSAGEATLVAITAAVVNGPELLLADEPLADLDTAARARVIAVLASLAREHGVCVVVAEHRAHALIPVADAWWRMEGGSLVPGEAPDVAATAAVSPTVPPAPLASPVLTVAGLSVERKGARLVRDAALSLNAGEIVALVGPNGAGKSSLLVELALGSHSSARVALVPDASDDLFTRDTVAGELQAAERRLNRRSKDSPREPGFAAAHLQRLRGNTSMPLGSQHPRDLSAGERRVLAVALQSLDSPQVLLIDEPTRGLDPTAQAAVAGALRTAAADGAAVLMATHDADFAAALGARVLHMHDGVVPVLPGMVATVPAEVEIPAPCTPALAAPATRLPATPRPARTGLSGTSLALPRGAQFAVLAAANLVALAAFCWPLLAAALPDDATAALPFAALAIAPVAAIAVVVSLDGSVRSAHTVALLGVLAAVGSAVRVASTGVGGVEAVFILLILAGRAFGARFGLLLGAATIALSSALWGGLGPWTPFQIFACAWVGAGAGLLPRQVRGKAELWMLAGYGIVASYLFGLLTNLWFWPFAVGTGTGISYVAGAPLSTNLSSFLLYSLLTSTAGWDTLRAVTTVIGVAVVGRAVLAALRRAKPVTA